MRPRARITLVVLLALALTVLSVVPALASSDWIPYCYTLWSIPCAARVPPTVWLSLHSTRLCSKSQATVNRATMPDMALVSMKRPVPSVWWLRPLSVGDPRRCGPEPAVSC
jgi:hypothetical protein